MTKVPPKSPNYPSYNSGLLQLAIIKWRGFDNRSLSNKDLHEFATFIGYPHNPHTKGSLIVDTTLGEVRRIIDLINGPNGTAILKILQIKHEERWPS